jgi:DcmR-like sensory protein
MKYLEPLQLGQPALALDEIVVVENHPHFVEFYDTEAFLVHCVQDFLAAGVVAGDAVIMNATDAHRNAFDRALREAGTDIHRAQRGGRFTTQATADALARFMVEDIPDPRRFRATHAFIAKESAGGYRALRGQHFESCFIVCLL